jgi:hypothetical protein
MAFSYSWGTLKPQTRRSITRDFLRTCMQVIHLAIVFALLPLLGFGQPTIIATVPALNATTTSRTSSVQAVFNQPLAAGSTAAMKVYSAQRGGLRSRGSTVAVVSGSLLSFTPPASLPWLPGETIYTTITTSARSATGSLVKAQVRQFTTAVGGTGRGKFTSPTRGAELAVGAYPYRIATGDVDGDGDLDFLTANSDSRGTVSVRLNDGQGNFSSPASNAEPAVGNNPYDLVLGDVDGDGDLDLLTANYNTQGTVSVRLNDGYGSFTAPPVNAEPTVGNNPYSVKLGDVDGDGDLDLFTANYTNNGTVSVRLNDGQGNFTASTPTAEVTVSPTPISVTLGDVDGDGDLDILTANYSTNTANVRFNDGQGVFTAPPTNTSVGSYAYYITLGDIDGDGDLDLLTANGSNTVSVRFNNGQGTFTAPSKNAELAVDLGPTSLALGDIDGDGDLDLLSSDSGSNKVSLCLNDGQGVFTPQASPAEPIVGSLPTSVVLSDLDGDGDLDLLTANAEEKGTVSIRLNNPLVPLPVELVRFTATNHSLGVTLAWATASELNSARFEVERSADGVAFTTVATIIAAGTSTLAHTYSFLDTQLPLGTASVYYRLRQLDLNGTIHYSPVRSVTRGDISRLPQLLVYPNPAHEAVQVQLVGLITTVPLEIYDRLGRVIYTQPASALGSETHLVLPSMASGLYLLRWGELTKRLVVE